MFLWLLFILLMVMMNFLFPVLDLYLDIIDGVRRYIKVLVSFLAKRWNFCQFIFQLGQKL